MGPAELVDRYIEACAARGLAPQTLLEQRGCVRHFLRWVGSRDPGSLTAAEVRAYSDELRALPLARHTRARRLWIIVDLFEWLSERDLIAANPASGICPKSFPKCVPTESEITRILAVPNVRTAIGRRDRAILELMYSAGLGAMEVSRLDLQDVDLANGIVSVRCRGKARAALLGEAARGALLDYFERSRPGFEQTPGSTALFLSSDQSVRAGNRLTPTPSGLSSTGSREKPASAVRSTPTNSAPPARPTCCRQAPVCATSSSSSAISKPTQPR